MKSIDEEVEEDVIELVKKMFREQRENKRDDSIKTAKYLIEVIETYIKCEEALKSYGLPYKRLEYTGEKIGGLRIFKTKDE